MKSRLILVLFVILLFDVSLSAMVAQDKVTEMIQQAQHQLLSASSGDLQHPATVRDQQAAQLVEPLSLQLAVLQVTDSLKREMSLPKWQAMLRALGGDREILKRFVQLRTRFSTLEKQVGQAGDEWAIVEQLKNLAELETSSTSWGLLWSQLHNLIQTVNNLYEWFDRYQRNAAVVNERTLRDFADTVHGQDNLTTGKVLESIHKAVCPVGVGTDSYNWRDITTHTNQTGFCSGGAFEVFKTALLQVNRETV